ncbi:CHY zinc finger protein [Alicyclobacillus macrosporangiidus]|uniref:CHY zinc finger protein n=1 Tax=Alicyclobacillus macrosporangiidus TaxID=392015 RepID=UPI002F35D198
MASTDRPEPARPPAVEAEGCERSPAPDGGGSPESRDPVVTVVVHGVPVRGVGVDAQTRCVHYASDVDVIALRFDCCDTYYPCHLCHEAAADHPPRRWPRSRFGEPAVLCGVCGHRMTVSEYLSCASRCPRCGAAFNPGCKHHLHLYFELSP